MADDDLTADLTPEEVAELDRVYAALADEAVWTEPGPDLQERIVAAIARAERHRRRPRVWYAVGASAAAVLLTVGVAIGLQLQQDEQVQYAAALAGTDIAPDAKGDVTLTRTTSGWRIELHATGLPRRADGEFYEAWLKDARGTLIPIGTFNDGREVVLWAGAPPSAYPTLTVTREVADGNQASSGEVVLVGRAHESR